MSTTQNASIGLKGTLLIGFIALVGLGGLAIYIASVWPTPLQAMTDRIAHSTRFLAAIDRLHGLDTRLHLTLTEFSAEARDTERIRIVRADIASLDSGAKTIEARFNAYGSAQSMQTAMRECMKLWKERHALALAVVDGAENALPPPDLAALAETRTRFDDYLYRLRENVDFQIAQSRSSAQGYMERYRRNILVVAAVFVAAAIIFIVISFAAYRRRFMTVAANLLACSKRIAAMGDASKRCDHPRSRAFSDDAFAEAAVVTDGVEEMTSLLYGERGEGWTVGVFGSLALPFSRRKIDAGDAEIDEQFHMWAKLSPSMRATLSTLMRRLDPDER